jgi:stage II sporulation protein AB (anti-sigma F factor)
MGRRESMATYLDVSFPALPSSVREARQAVAGIVARMGGTDRVVDDVRLCVSEAVANAVRHAYVSEPGIVDVSVDRSHGELTVVVRDEGRGLPEVRHEGKLGFGLRIIEKVALGYEISSGRERGTTIQMSFAWPP